MRGQRHAPAALYLRERPGTHFTGGWVGLRAGLDGRKISFPPGFDPRTVQPLASRYTDWAISAHQVQVVSYKNEQQPQISKIGNIHKWYIITEEISERS